MHILFDLCSKFDFCRNSGLIPGEIQRRKSNIWREHVLLLNTRWRYASRQCVNMDPFLVDLLCHIMVNRAAVDGQSYRFVHLVRNIRYIVIVTVFLGCFASGVIRHRVGCGAWKKCGHYSYFPSTKHFCFLLLLCLRGWRKHVMH